MSFCVLAFFALYVFFAYLCSVEKLQADLNQLRLIVSDGYVVPPTAKDKFDYFLKSLLDTAGTAYLPIALVAAGLLYVLGAAWVKWIYGKEDPNKPPDEGSVW